MKFPPAILVLAGCLVAGFAIVAPFAQVMRGRWLEALVAIFLLTGVSFFVSANYLAPKYGEKMPLRGYSFDDDSPMALFLPLGIVLIILEGGILYCIGRNLW